MVQRHSVMGSFVLAIFLASSVSAQAVPDAIPGEIIRSTSLAGTQLTTIKEYAAYWADKLINGTDQELIVARGKLINPLKKGGSAVFNETYDKEVATNIAPGTKSDKVLVRINVMIVAKELFDDKVDEVIFAGLKDASPPVKLIGGKAAGNLTGADSSRVSSVRKAGLQKALVDALEGEKSPWVFEGIAGALIELGEPKAYLQVLESINKRVDQHAKKVTKSIGVDLALLNNVYVRLVRTIASEGKQVDRQVLIQYCKVMYRIAKLSVEVRAGGASEPDVDSLLSQITDLSSTVLRYFAEKVAPSAKLPDNWSRAQLPVQQLAITDFGTILLLADFGLKPDELKVKMPGE